MTLEIKGEKIVEKQTVNFKIGNSTDSPLGFAYKLFMFPSAVWQLCA
jgi:hypothetical protein